MYVLFVLEAYRVPSMYNLVPLTGLYVNTAFTQLPNLLSVCVICAPPGTLATNCPLLLIFSNPVFQPSPGGVFVNPNIGPPVLSHLYIACMLNAVLLIPIQLPIGAERTSLVPLKLNALPDTSFLSVVHFVAAHAGLISNPVLINPYVFNVTSSGKYAHKYALLFKFAALNTCQLLSSGALKYNITPSFSVSFSCRTIIL
ncbi:MAG: hypothetical protein BWY26_00067 [Elusimicrobia bacterium ADurb.Bin231]|nr:MAG: hypothetical protein BWY26_00067 [Elusimicrobia bacterium ADurb.Bin231]